MLTLTRKEGDILNVYTTDGIIRFHIKSFRNGQVRIGVDAPMTVRIKRNEIDDDFAAFSADKNATIPDSKLPKLHRSLVSRIILSVTNFLNRPFNTTTAKYTQ